MGWRHAWAGDVHELETLHGLETIMWAGDLHGLETVRGLETFMGWRPCID